MYKIIYFIPYLIAVVSVDDKILVFRMECFFIIV